MKTKFKVLIVLGIILTIVGLKVFVPKDYWQELGEETRSEWQLWADSADIKHQSIKRNLQQYTSKDDYDFSKEPTIEGDSTAQDISRQGKEAVHIHEEEKETWYINGKEIKEYYEAVKETIRKLRENKESD